MNNSHTSTYYLQQQRMSILPNFSIDIFIEKNPYNLPIDQLFEMAARINKKRSFLFVSKVLGKHIPVSPYVPHAIGLLLGATYAKIENKAITQTLVNTITGKRSKDLPEYFIKKEKPIIIGFAETATALGHSFFKAFEDATYVHTTREVYTNEQPLIMFEEEHSHATSHYLYAPKDFFNNDKEVILVDDELTTGKTNLNIIRALHAIYPRKKYTLVSILDWRTKEHIQQFEDLENELNIEIQAVSLIKGNFELLGQPNLTTEKLYERTSNSLIVEDVLVKEILPEAYYRLIDGNDTFYKQGRFTIHSSEQKNIDSQMKKIAFELNCDEKEEVLCIGTGEFMYIPMQIASLLNGNVFYQSTTRSPIFPLKVEGYGVKSKILFSNFDQKEQTNYLYNLEDKKYTTIVIFLEKNYSNEQLQPLMTQLQKLSAKKLIKIIF